MLKDKLNIMNRHPSKIKKESKVLFVKENDYEIVKLIGQGTFGKVYLVVHKKTNQRYAMKQVVQDPKYKNRELSIISQMDHPNIIEMKDYFFKLNEHQCVLHIIMDFMDTSLHSLLKQQRKTKSPVPQKHRKLLAFQLFKSLYYLAINNVCHRDLKPPNILINTGNCELKICDFGSAKIIQTKQNNVSYICSRYYRAPQLILNSSTYGCQIDMWSAGCILAEFMTLEPIFPGDSSIQQLIEIIKLLGTPKRKEIAKFSKQNSLIPLPKVKKSDLSKILGRYDPQQTQLDLIRQLLTYDIEARITPYQALFHPYFSDLPGYSEVSYLPDLFDFQCLRNSANKKQIDVLEDLYQTLALKHNREEDKVQETADSLHKTSDI